MTRHTTADSGIAHYSHGGWVYKHAAFGTMSHVLSGDVHDIYVFSSRPLRR